MIGKTLASFLVAVLLLGNAMAQDDNRIALEEGVYTLVGVDRPGPVSFTFNASEPWHYTFEAVDANNASWQINGVTYSGLATVFLDAGSHLIELRSKWPADVDIGVLEISRELQLDFNEPDDLPRFARHIELGAPTTTWLRPRGDADWFAVTPPAAGQMVIEVLPTDGESLGPLEALIVSDGVVGDMLGPSAAAAGGYFSPPISVDGSAPVIFGYRFPPGSEREAAIEIMVHFASNEAEGATFPDRELTLPVFVIGVDLAPEAASQLRVVTNAAGGAFIDVADAADLAETVEIVSEASGEITGDNDASHGSGVPRLAMLGALILVFIGVIIAARRRQS